MISKGLFSSNTNEWATPQAFYNELNAEFHFNLDPCSTHENAKCEKHFTLAENGLLYDWGGIMSFVIPLMRGKSQSGSRRRMRNPRNPIPSL